MSKYAEKAAVKVKCGSCGSEFSRTTMTLTNTLRWVCRICNNRKEKLQNA